MMELPAQAVLTRYSITKQGLVALFTEEGFLFSVDEDTFEEFGLALAIKNGSPLDGGELHLLAQKSESAHARQTALRLLTTRMYAQQELYRRLCKTYDARAAAHAMAEAERLGFLDDAAFARARAGVLLRKNRSRSAIVHDLTEKGVDRALAGQALEEVWQERGEELEENAAALRRLIEKQYARKLAAGQEDKVRAALARRGFAGYEVRRALEAWRRENPTPTDDE